MFITDKDTFLKYLQIKIDASDKNTPVSLVLVKSALLNNSTRTVELMEYIKALSLLLIEHHEEKWYRVNKDKYAMVISKKDSFQLKETIVNFFDRTNKKVKNNLHYNNSNYIYMGITSTVSKSVNAPILFSQATSALTCAIKCNAKKVLCYKDIVFSNFKPGVKLDKYHF